MQTSISDNGTGINDDELDEVFEPFFSTRTSAQLVAQTPGLGLTMVRGIVHQNDGHLLLESTVGSGTRVSMLYPTNG